MSLTVALPKSKVFLRGKITNPGLQFKLPHSTSAALHFASSIKDSHLIKKLNWDTRPKTSLQDDHFRSSSTTFCCNDTCRTFTSFSSLVFQCSSLNDNDNKNNGKMPTTNDNQENGYDPKNDSFFTQETAFGSPENKGLGEPGRPVFIPESDEFYPPTSTESEEDLNDLAAPTNCCMSGCPNCVWIDYVDKLSKRYEDPSLGRERILKELEVIDDQNIKAYIMMELRIKKLI